MKKVAKIFDFRNWEKDTQKVVAAVLAIFLVMSVFAIFKPSRQTVESHLSDNMRELVKADAERKYKTVTVTYNDLYFINYCSYVAEGAKGVSEKFLGFAGQVYDANDGIAGTVGQLVNYTYRMLGCGQSMLYGAKLTLVLTSLSMVVGIILSIFLALGKISKHKIFSVPCSAYIFFFRGTPLMIQIMAIYLAIPNMIKGFNWKGLFPANDTEAVFKGAFVAGLIAFTLNNGAYCAEIVRAAIQSIDKGQYEAGKALGFTHGQTMSKIIIPQTFRRLVPPLANEFIMIIKDASLVFVIGLMDISTISKGIAAQGSYLVFLPALVIYLIITAFFTFVFGKIEKRLGTYEN